MLEKNSEPGSAPPASNPRPRLGEVEPRERAGARTEDRYEYQCERTARAAIELLNDDANCVCVYCDWHDDYVVEVSGDPTEYKFYQVKGKALSAGPWTTLAFWGVTKPPKGKSKPPATVREDAVFPRLLAHITRFHKSCAGLAFVTNSELIPELSEFINSISAAPSLETVAPSDRALFHHLYGAYVGTVPPLVGSLEGLFHAIRSLTVYVNQGVLDDRDAGIRELADMCVTHSEIEVVTREAKQMARDLVEVVRNKVRHATTVVPTSETELRKQKGVVVADVLSVLSLSVQGYEALKQGISKDVVKQLSRVQRFCELHGFEPHLKEICAFRAGWVVWLQRERHFLESVEYTSIIAKVRELLASRPTIEKIVAESKDIAKQFAGLSVGNPLTPEHVAGLVFTIAADSEEIK